MAAGTRMAIADGTELTPNARRSALAPGFCRTQPKTARSVDRQRLEPAGTIVIDDGALGALNDGKSLLPAGVTGIQGRFKRGDAVVVAAHDGREIARGITAYSANDARRIMGNKTSEIEGILGYRGRDEMVHRDDLVLI